MVFPLVRRHDATASARAKAKSAADGAGAARQGRKT
jgi:hypothetical protein